MKKFQLPIFMFIYLSFIQSSNSANKRDEIGRLQLDLAKDIYFNHPDSARMIIASVLKKAHRLDNDYLLAEAFYSEAQLFKETDKHYDKALISYYRSLKYYKRTKQMAGIAKCIKELAVCNLYSYNYDIALELYQEELQYRLRLSDEVKLATCYFNIGLSLSYLKSNDSAISYINNALEVIRPLENNNRLMNYYFELGNCYYQKKMYDSAMSQYTLSMKIAIEQNDSFFLAKLYQNMGTVNTNMKQYEQALVYYEKTLVSKDYLADQYQSILTYCNLGKLYYLMKDNNKALMYLEKALDLDYNLTNKTVLADIYEQLIILNVEMNNIEALKTNSLAFAAHNRTIVSEVMLEKFKAERAKNLYEKDILTSTEQKQALYLKWLAIVLISTIVLLLVIVHFLRKTYRTKRVQTNMIEYLKQRDSFIYALKQDLKFDIATIVKRLEQIDPRTSYQSILDVYALDPINVTSDKKIVYSSRLSLLRI